MTDLSEEFNRVQKKIAEAKDKCERTYDPWRDATDRLHELERERSRIWNKMLDEFSAKRGIEKSSIKKCR